MEKMTTISLFFSVLLGLFIVTLFGIIAFLVRLYINRGTHKKYLYDVAIGIDELGGTLIYGTKDKTVSHMTGYFKLQGNILAIVLSAFIDFLFGKNHCVDTYIEDLRGEKEYVI